MKKERATDGPADPRILAEECRHSISCGAERTFVARAASEDACPTTSPTVHLGFAAFLDLTVLGLVDRSLCFRAFIRSVLMGGAGSASGDVDSASAPRANPWQDVIWPMPPPFPRALDLHISAALTNIEASCGSRLQAAVPVQHRCYLSTLVVFLSWLHLGRPWRAPSRCSPVFILDGRQEEAVLTLWAASAPLCAAATIADLDLGRSAAKLENVMSYIGHITTAAASLYHHLDPYHGHRPVGRAGNVSRDRDTVVIGKMGSQVIETAREIVSSRITVRDRPRFNPVPVLDPDTAAAYHDPDLLRDPAFVPVDVPRTRVRASRAEA